MAKAQDTVRTDQPTEVKSMNKISLNLFGITAEREQKVGRITTVNGGLGVFGTYVYGTAIHYNSVTNQITFKKYNDFKFYPVVYGGIKHYYNFKQRIKKGKKTSNNGANYVGLDVMGVFPTLFEDDTLLSSQLNIAPRWGFQRRLGNKGTFEFGIGPAMAFAQGNTYYGATGKIAFSLLL
ncbi:hypothetical protein [Pedobacter sp. ASV12]|uniref:hypothetical protein n=1 Tax=Pedobacter sp. ASV12 TaxID=2795120 RepID=UPI0018ECF41E|nr:hypothetical protein [Pedobacter sp. ASV12]